MTEPIVDPGRSGKGTHVFIQHDTESRERLYGDGARDFVVVEMQNVAQRDHGVGVVVGEGQCEEFSGPSAVG